MSTSHVVEMYEFDRLCVLSRYQTCSPACSPGEFVSSASSIPSSVITVDCVLLRC